MNRGARTKIKTHFNHLEKDAAEQFLMRPKSNGKKFTPSARELGRFLIKTEGAIHWSVKRLVENIRYSSRTIKRATAELRAEGFLQLIRRRRSPTLKVICIDAIRDGAAKKITLAIKRCAEAIRNLPQNLEGPRLAPTSHFIVRDFAYRTQNGASEGLKRAAAALSRTPKLFGA